MRRRSVLAGAAGLLLAACGIKGVPPQPRATAPVGDLRVEGRDAAVRVSWVGRPAGVAAFEVLRRKVVEDARTYFERIGTVEPAGNARYAFLDRTPEPGATYVYRVRPRRDDPQPSQVRFTGPQESFTWREPPAAPTGVRSQPLNAGARLFWDPVPGADGYRVYQRDPKKTLLAEPANRGLVDKTSWVAVALPDGRSICYVVRAVRLPGRAAEGREVVGPPDDEIEAPSGAEVGDAAARGISIPRQNATREVRRAVSELAGEGALPGIESASSDETCVTPGLTEPPPPPRRVGAAVVAEGVSLSWHPSSGEEVVGYHVERREVGADGNPKGTWLRVTEAPVGAAGYLDRTVKKGERYEFQVRSVDASGAEGPPSTPTRPLAFQP